MHFVRFPKRRDHAEEAEVEVLLHGTMELSSAGSHENLKRAATFMLQVHATQKARPVQPAGETPLGQDSTSQLTNEALAIFGVRLLGRFERFGDMTYLQQAIAALEQLVKSTSIWDDRYHARLGNLALATRYRFNHLGALSDLEDVISMQRVVADLTPDGHPDKPRSLTHLGSSWAFLIRFEHLGRPSDLEDAIKNAVDLTPDGHPHKPSHLNNFANPSSLCDQTLKAE